MTPDALLGAAVVVILTLGGAIIHLVFRAGQLTTQLREIQKDLRDSREESARQANGVHRRFTEQDASLDATRTDLTAIRIELELNDYVRLRPKTQA